jgi:hypothetical protein
VLYSSDRTRLRRAFSEAWRKRVQGLPLEPVEMAIAEVVADHPEYRSAVEDESSLERDFVPEGGTNPFLHMAMHLALREQRGTDRPPGIAPALSALDRRLGDVHAAEHQAMECLGRALWDAQARGTPPDERRYLECVRALAFRRR